MQMLMLLSASRFRIFKDFSKPSFNCFFKAAQGLKYLYSRCKGDKSGFLKASQGGVHRFQGGFRKTVCSSLVALEQHVHTKSVKKNKSKLFARGKIKLLIQ
jgi:hypothetical protein